MAMTLYRLRFGDPDRPQHRVFEAPSASAAVAAVRDQDLLVASLPLAGVDSWRDDGWQPAPRRTVTVSGKRGAYTVTVTQDGRESWVIDGLETAPYVRQAVYSAMDTWREPDVTVELVNQTKLRRLR